MSDALFSLQGKVALITGASKEMGQGVAYTLAEHGADVALTARTAAQLDDLAARIRRLGRKLLELCGGARGQRHVSTVFRQRVSHPLSHLLAGAGNQRDFPLQRKKSVRHGFAEPPCFGGI